MPAWTEEMDATLKREAAAGLSASQIATVISGVTRSAVIGRAHRLKVQIGASRVRTGRAKPPPQPAKLVPAPKGHRFIVPGQIAIAPPKVVTRHEPKVKLPPPRPAEIVSIGVTIDALTLRTCRAPLWGNVLPPTEEAFYCGAETVPGHIYCAGHRYRFTERPAPKAAKEAA